MIAIGVILFPMIVLCVSLGGFSCLWRVDLIVLTILRTPAPYLVTLAFILATWVVEVLLKWCVFADGHGSHHRGHSWPRRWCSGPSC